MDDNGWESRKILKLYDALYAEAVVAHLNTEEDEVDKWKYEVEYFGARAAVKVYDERGVNLGSL